VRRPTFTAGRSPAPWAGLRAFLLAGCAASIADQHAVAQSQSPELDAPRVEVVAQRDPALALTAPGVEAAQRQIQQVPGGANVIDSTTYKQGRAASLVDALGLSPGVFVQERIPGAEEARLSIRGSGIQRTFHLRGIRILQDGVPVNQADGGGDFQAIEPLAARYVEVFRGANALQYGSTTLGGAINYVTYSGHDAAPLQARVEGGSYGYLRGQASLGGVAGRTDYYASLTHFSQDGYRDHSEQNNQRVFGDLGIRLTENLETRFWFSYAQTDSELPGNLTKAQLEDDPRQPNPVNALNDYQRDFDLYRFANQTVYQFGANRVEGGLYYVTKDLWHPIFQVLDIDSEDVGLSLRFVSQAPLLGRPSRFTLGVNLAHLDQQDNRFVNLGGAAGARTAQSDQTASNVELYAEELFYLFPRDALVFGAQFTRATRKYEDRFLSNGDNGFSVDYDAVSPKLGWLHEASPAVQLFANYSESFEPPSFGELAGGPSITQVDAQQAQTWEIGSRGALPRIAWDVALYRAQVEDELLAQNAPDGTPLGTVNARRTLHQGLELGLASRPVRWLELRAAYLWNDFRFDDHPVYGDNELPGIPEHFLRAELLVRAGETFYAGPTLEWSPSDYPVDMANTLYADSYAIVGFKLGQQRTRGWSWYLEARNLFDETYAASTGVIADARGLDSAQFLPGQGFSVYAGLEWRR
jgi:iron complex outermembrane receptor protein